MERLGWSRCKTELGGFLLGATSRGLAWVTWQETGDLERLNAFATRNRCELGRAAGSPHLERAAVQLAEYARGERREFDLALELLGTPFQVQVWEALREIPYGTTMTYGLLAQRVGSPGGSRAVGGANGKNPIPVIVPCHRVVSAGGLGGFRGGLARKEALLVLEGARLV
jgi:O-6-methylguanine DNA methyltransferase